ncbi:MAG: glutamate racemase [Eubacteriales bacterium]|nr:glutamate racemase [Eubacteriales bacterium]
MVRATDPVGVFDSGVGGISVLAEMRRVLPNEDFLFYGDTAHAPYGTKRPEEVLGFVRGVMAHLENRGVKAVVIACNTATSVAAEELRRTCLMPIIGMEPALKPAHELRHGGQILVLATPMTLRLPKFQRLMERYGEGVEPLPCPGLMDLVEQEDFVQARRYLQEHFAPFDMARVDAVVLGCTHYSFLRPVLRELLPENVPVLDGNQGTARQLARVLAARGLLNPGGAGSITLETSGDPAVAIPVMERLLARA